MHVDPKESSNRISFVGILFFENDFFFYGNSFSMTVVFFLNIYVIFLNKSKSGESHMALIVMVSLRFSTMAITRALGRGCLVAQLLDLGAPSE